MRLLLAALLAVGPALAPASVPRGPDPVVLAVVADLRWDPPPAGETRALLNGALVAALVPATARQAGCAADFWLTVSAGARAGLPGSGCAVPEVVPSGNGATVAGWAAIVRANDRRHFGAVPGTLGRDLHARSGSCIAAYGPLAALGAADRTGLVREYHASVADAPRRQTHCRDTFVDASDYASPAAATAALRAAFPSHTILLVGLPRPGHYGALANPTNGTALLTGSPRERGLVTIPDLTRRVLSPSSLTVSSRGASATRLVAHLRDLDRAGHLHRAYAGWYLGLGALPLLLYLILAWRPRLGRRLRPVALALAAYPVAGFLVSAVPWWRAGTPWLACAAGVLASMVLVVAAGRGTEVGIAAVTTAVFAVDLLTGAHLQRFGLASYTALNGGRFFGLGNVGFAIFATAAVVLAGALARRYGARAWLAAYPPLVLLDALPRWGADFGGAIALTAAFGTALATRARRTVVVAGAALGLVVAFAAAWLDYSRPAADRTHLGAFVDDLLHGNAADPLWRKADAAIHSVVGTAYPLILIGSLVVATILLRRLRDEALAPTVRAVAVLWLVGSLVNDSGVVVATAGAAVAVPLLLAYAIRRAPDGTPW
jgi:hypothetical protein